MSYTYIFGPVASSRLGYSLGLDLLGKRICSMDCLYCEVGKTDTLTTERAPYVPAEVILEELERWAQENTDRPDHVTLGGSGEPCLNSELAQIISGCRRILPDTPVAVLTNAVALDDSNVIAALMDADVVLPSMDSLVESEFRKLNRPCGGVTAEHVRKGVLSFAAAYTGTIFLEILLVQGINDSDENLALLKEFVRELDPDRVDVTTISRPGTLDTIRPVTKEQRTTWCDAFENCLTRPDSPGTVFLRTGQRADFVERDLEAAADMLLRSLQRRPQTPGQLAMALALSLEKVEAALALLEQRGTVQRTTLSQNAAPPHDVDEPFYSCQ